MAWQSHPSDSISIVVTAGQTVSETVHIGNPSELGLLVPALTTATTVTVQVGAVAAGTDRRGIVDQAGTAKLALASGSGNVAISSLEMGAVLGYPYLTVVLGAAQAADKTFTLTRKSVSVSG